MFRPSSRDVSMPGEWARPRSILLRDGYTVLDDVFSSELLGALRAEADRLTKALVHGSDGMVVATDPNGAVLSVRHLDRSSDLLFDLIRLPDLMEAAEALLEARCVPFLTEYFAKPSWAAERTPAHQDQIFYRDHFGDELAVTFWIPLASVGLDDGVLEYAVPQPPGMSLLRHRVSAVQNFDAELVSDATLLFRPAPVPAGGVVVHHSFAVHRSGSVTAGSHRTAFALNYRRSPYRQRVSPWTP
jgi:hypothetical protein